MSMPWALSSFIHYTLRDAQKDQRTRGLVVNLHGVSHRIQRKSPWLERQALGAQTAGSGRSVSPDCWIWKLWELRLLDLDALGVQIAGHGRSESPDCWIRTLWEFRLLDLDALGAQIAGFLAIPGESC